MSSHLNITTDSENVEQYLQYISNLDLSPKQKFDLLYIVHSILSYFVDQAFNVQTDQLTLQSIGRDFTALPSHAMLESNPENQTNDVLNKGVEPDSNPAGPTKP